VHGVSVNPHDRSVFATCGADGSLRVYAQYRARRTLSMEPCDGALFCVQWSPARPLVVAAGTASGRVVVYDLSKGGGDATQPTVSFGGEDEGEAPSAVHAVAFNPSLPEYLASADASGVRVWELGGRLRNARSNEARVLGRLARAESPAEAAAALARGR
jgi:WD40 repeat protein